MGSDRASDTGIRDMTFRVVQKEGFSVVGIPQSSDTKSCFGSAWTQFDALKDAIPNRVDEIVGYGLQIYPPQDVAERHTYMACCEVTDLAAIPLRFVGASVPATEYAVFTVTNWNETIGRAWGAAYGEILPKSDYKAYLPCDFERYDGRAFGETPENQIMEIWIPVAPK